MLCPSCVCLRCVWSCVVRGCLSTPPHSHSHDSTCSPHPHKHRTHTHSTTRQSTTQTQGHRGTRREVSVDPPIQCKGATSLKGPKQRLQGGDKTGRQGGVGEGRKGGVLSCSQLYSREGGCQVRASTQGQASHHEGSGLHKHIGKRRRCVRARVLSTSQGGGGGGE
jgi:hypothetical protein